MQKVISLVVLGFVLCSFDGLAQTLPRGLSAPPATDPEGPQPPPAPECTPIAGKRNAWHCDGPPEAEPLDADEQEELDFIRARHPKWVVPMDGASIDTDAIPQQFIDQYRRSKNPNYMKKIDGFTPQRLTELVDRNQAKLMKINGVRGASVDSEGIVVEAETVHGSIPRTLEGARVRVVPWPGPATWVGNSNVEAIRPVMSGTAFGSRAFPGQPSCTLSGGAVGIGIAALFFPAHCLPFPFCGSYADANFRIPGSIFQMIPYAGTRTSGTLSEHVQITQPPIWPVTDLNAPYTYPTVGWAAMWENTAVHIAGGPAGLNTPGTDLAAAYLDNNLTERDGSLSMELYTGVHTPNPDEPEIEGKYYRTAAAAGKIKGIMGAFDGVGVTIYTRDPANTGITEITGNVIHWNYPVYKAGGFCGPNELRMWSEGNLRLANLSRRIYHGDSGAPIVTNGSDGLAVPGFLVGTLNWARYYPDPTHPLTGLDAGGESIQKIIAGLGLDNDLPPLKNGEKRSITQIINKHTYTLDVRSQPSAITAAKVGQYACGYVQVRNPGKRIVYRVMLQKGPDTPSGSYFVWYNPDGKLQIPYTISPKSTVAFRVCFGAGGLPLETHANRIRVFGRNGLSPVVRPGYNTFGAIFTAAEPPSFRVLSYTDGPSPDVHVNEAPGVGHYYTYMQNVGAVSDATIIPAVDYGGTGTSLPLNATICEMDVVAPITGARSCSQGLTPTVTSFFNRGQYRYYYVYLQRTGAPIHLEHFYHRVGTKVMVNNKIHGEASLSVTTD